ncbi:tetratricopeptide repeat protein 8 isoform X2 [Coccinella septempunctata]|nr:tetratricopeptide repeat protein 8 isoform X2 [Coccinella septempunctata]XP_044754058.1 tetratricopeptide repeat protein 8 isoform X2 [Coccinella septempunctata]
MDRMYEAISLFRRKKYDECIEKCTEILDSNPLDQAAWCLKMRAITQRVYVDDIETEDALESDIFDTNIVATAPRPGTSLKTSVASTSSNNLPFSARPRTSTGRPLTGIVRPGTQKRPGSTLESLKTSRPLTSQSSRAIRIGTAAMLSQKDGPFIQVSRLNISKYARDPCLSKPLFEYLFYCEGDVRNAMELAVLATQYCEFKDWWWKVQLAKCYVVLSLPREAEEQLRSALKQQNHVETFIRLSRIYTRLDQPLAALDVCKTGLEVFPNDVTLLVEMARLNENLENSSMSIRFYRSAVIEDAMNTESIACIGMYHFYNNQPELALRYYRRVLAMGAHSAELYNNLGLCCLYSQQLDLTLSCFQRALDLAIDPLIKAEVWYNLAHTALAAGDLELAILCLNICINADPTHAPAFNNLAVLHQKTGRKDLAKVYFQSAKNLQEDMEEANANLEILLKK